MIRQHDAAHLHLTLWVETKSKTHNVRRSVQAGVNKGEVKRREERFDGSSEFTGICSELSRPSEGSVSYDLCHVVKRSVL